MIITTTLATIFALNHIIISFVTSNSVTNTIIIIYLGMPGPLNIIGRLMLHYLIYGDILWRAGESYEPVSPDPFWSVTVSNTGR